MGLILSYLNWKTNKKAVIEEREVIDLTVYSIHSIVHLNIVVWLVLAILVVVVVVVYKNWKRKKTNQKITSISKNKNGPYGRCEHRCCWWGGGGNSGRSESSMKGYYSLLLMLMLMMVMTMKTTSLVVVAVRSSSDGNSVEGIYDTLEFAGYHHW